MSKKNFKKSNPALAYISKNKDSKDTLDTQEVQSAPSTQLTPEPQQKPQAPSTQGRKGQKRQRINMAFDDENIEYLRLMSRFEGVSMTQYVNDLLDEDRKINDDKVKKIEKFFGE